MSSKGKGKAYIGTRKRSGISHTYQQSANQVCSTRPATPFHLPPFVYGLLKSTFGAVDISFSFSTAKLGFTL
ncbi:hypothetical protein C8R31_101214 [Nitrosospira sp. Nsp2]|nr:hypothetical protein C8R31_101214 [Nitrosospira sp. Nsp2]